MCSSCNLKIVPLSNAYQYDHTFPLVDLSKNSRCKFSTWFCASPAKVNAALAPLGITINNMEQMKSLADYYDSGEALGFYKVDLIEVLNKIVLTPEEQDNPSCKIACTY